MSKSNIDQKLESLGLSLPTPKPSVRIYKSCLTVGSMVYVSGHVSMNTDGSYINGKLGKDLSDEEGKKAALQCGLVILGSLKTHLGSLDKVKRVIKLLGMVNAIPDFRNHPQVINGCSELYVQLWGEENGKGVRSAVGMGSLPGNVAVEIEGIFEIE